jgi:hypothetical protein
VVAEVDPARPVAQPVPAEPIGREHDLQLRVAFLQHGEAQPAEVAHTHHAAGHRDRLGGGGVRAEAAEPLADLREPGRAGVAHRVGLDAVGEHLLVLRVAHPDLLGQAGAHLGERRGNGVGVRGGFRRDDRRAVRRRGPDALPLHPAQARRGEEPLGQRGGDADAGQVAGSPEAQVARRPVRLVLGVGAVERLELPPARTDQEQPPPQPDHGPGADLLALLEGGPEHGEVQREAFHAQRARPLRELGHHELGEPVVGRAVAAHQVEGEPVAAPRHEGQQRPQRALGVEALDQHAFAVGRVAEPGKRHGEAALGLGVAPGVGALDDLAHLLGRQLAVAPDGDGVAGPLDAAHRLAHRSHRAAFEGELPHLDDGLVAELDGGEARGHVGPGGLLARAHHGGDPAVAAGLVEPRVDGARPGLRVTDRVAAGQADGRDDPERHRRLAGSGEHRRLVAPGGEVAERVRRAEAVEQYAQPSLVIGAEAALVAAGPEQHVGGGEHGEHADQPEDERDGVRRRAVDPGDVGIPEPAQHERERPADAVLRGAQGAREELQQAPAEEAAEHDDADVDPERAPTASALGARREALAGQQEQHQRRHPEPHSQPAEDARPGGHGHRFLGVGVDQHRDPAQDAAEHDVEHDEPPCGPHAAAHGPGEDGEEGRGRQAGRRPDRHDLDRGAQPLQRLAQRRQQRGDGAERRDGGEVARQEVGHPVGPVRWSTRADGGVRGGPSLGVVQRAVDHDPPTSKVDSCGAA